MANQCKLCHRGIGLDEVQFNASVCLTCAPSVPICMQLYNDACLRLGHPNFLGWSHRCFSCFYDFTEKGTKIPSPYITGCDSCHRSFCD